MEVLDARKSPSGLSDGRMSASSDTAAQGTPLVYHGTWPQDMWASEPPFDRLQNNSIERAEISSVMSFASSSGAAPLERVLRPSQQLEVKVDMVYSLLSMLGTQECPDMGETLLALSTNPESSLAMRQAGCLPVLVQLVYSDKDRETRSKASKALYNLIQVQEEDKLRKREVKVLRLLEEINAYCDLVQDVKTEEEKEQLNNHPTQVTENIIKLSFDEGYRQTICELGGIYALANLVEADHIGHKSETDSEQCILIRRYSGMALTNLTFGHSQNKSLLCSFRNFMKCLVIQLKSKSDELRQVTASVVRNLSWRADASSRLILREVGAVPALMFAAIISHKESTLKSILSALWNLSAHCSMNKADICAVEGALAFLVDMLNYKPPSNTLAIIENAGGILRNISSHVAVREDYRAILRKHNCLQVLLQQLKSPSLTIVSNACGTLWNLSAKCVEDQKTLWDLGAAPMLRSLNHSKHIMIATGSRAALKNLLSSRPSHNLFSQIDTTAKELGLPALPTLGARKQRALAKELDQNLSETCENIEPTSPLLEVGKTRKFLYSKNDQTHTMYEQKDSLVDNFNSLTLNENNYIKKTQNGYNSLPYNSRTNRLPFSNFTDRSFEDDMPELCDMPVDYSQKYSEAKNTIIPKQEFSDQPVDYSNKYAQSPKELEEPIDYSKKYAEAKNYKPEFEPLDYTKANLTGALPKYNQEKVKSNSYDNIKTENNSYTDYAETDLDQPTNYSLRYGENDSDSDDCKPTQRYFEEPDQVRTYCTEGTPYETPYNFSTSTSLSDLRIDQNEDKNVCKSEPDKVKSETKTTPEKKLKSCYSSGLMSPDKPVNYCEEGTPGYFSRVSSLSSLNVTGLETTQDEKSKDVTSEDKEKIGELATSDEIKIESKTDRESGKVVKFGAVVDYAEETPLMFSRCSSLGSLSSTEQHSIHDDRSSVSDFSRLTSGIISPSELPDSPTQTIPPSPRTRKAPVEFPTVVTSTPQKSVFEDILIKFKEVNTPVEFSANTSLSSLTIDDEPSVPTKLTLLQNGTICRTITEESASGSTKDATKDGANEKKDIDAIDLSAVSEGEEDGDEDILAACINIGMQNNRHRQEKQPVSKLPTALLKYKSPARTGIPLPNIKNSRLPLSDPRIKSSEPSSDTLRTYCTEDTPAMLSNAGSNSDLSILSFNSKPVDDKIEFSDDSSNLSGDNDNILAECIQSGMPKARRQIVPPKIKAKGLPQTQGMPYFEAKDEMENYAVEDSPCHFSLRSSLSDLTVDGSVAGIQKTKQNECSNLQKVDTSSFLPKRKETTLNEASNLQKVDSLSSLSVDSYGSTENAEQALLEQCISSGMPSKTKNFIDTSSDKKVSKNVFATSVASNTNKTTDVEKNTKIKTENTNNAHAMNGYNTNYNQKLTNENVQPNSLDENMYTNDKNKYDINKCSDFLTDCSIEDNVSPEWSDSENKSKKINNRMLDPDAMIESLDRFTAELVSHSSHLNSHECKLPSNEGNNTWDEDTSPNDISFPSISLSAPLIASFKSETESKISHDTTDGLSNKEKEENQFSSMNTMTESTIIAIEANKVYNVVKLEAEMIRSVTSMNSLDLENINPPSMMESIISLTSSASELKNSPKNSPLLRKKSVPVMVRRALGNTNTRSIENLDSISNLEHVKPPSIMGDYLDMVDMESSMVSVASITSEIAESKDDPKKETPKWYYDFTTCDIDNINPPSLLNDVTDLCNSTADIITDKIFSETDVFEDCFTHTVDQTLQPGDELTADEITEYSDANSLTPIQSDFATSSAESTPKRHKNVNKRLTPKQKRQLAKERYKTYTVAAEMVTREINNQDVITESPDSNGSLDISSASSSGSPKVTPKERRLMDRDRFQTRVLEKLPEVSNADKFATFSREKSSNEKSTYSKKSGPSISTDEFKTAKSSLQMSLSRLETQNESDNFDKFATFNKKTGLKLQSSLPKLDISKSNSSQSKVNESKSFLQSPKTPPMSPSRTKTDIRKAMQQKRIENKERFRTRTISTDSPSPEVSPVPERRQMTADELHQMLERETNIILNTLENTSGVDDYLECETMSLVSNDDDSEHNSMSSINYRTYHKSWAFSKHLPVVDSQSGSTRSTKNLITTPKTLPTLKTNLLVSKTSGDIVSCQIESENEESKSPKIVKPKIVKPGETPIEIQEEKEEVKVIRGKKKAYISPYRSSHLSRPKQMKTLNSNLVKNITSKLTNKTPILNRSKTASPTVRLPQKTLKPSSGFNSRTTANCTSLPLSTQKQTQKRQSLPPKVERQETFVKEPESEPPQPDSSEKVKPISKIARAIGACKSKSATSLKTPKLQSKTVTSTTKTDVGRSIFYSRSPSADRDFVSRVKTAGMHASTSSQRLQSQESSKVKKSSIPSMTPRSNSNVSIASNESVKKKQVTSKIASLWKRVEESKKKTEKKDTKVWITAETSTDQANCDSTIVTF